MLEEPKKEPEPVPKKKDAFENFDKEYFIKDEQKEKETSQFEKIKTENPYIQSSPAEAQDESYLDNPSPNPNPGPFDDEFSIEDSAEEIDAKPDKENKLELMQKQEDEKREMLHKKMEEIRIRIQKIEKDNTIMEKKNKEVSQINQAFQSKIEKLQLSLNENQSSFSIQYSSNEKVLAQIERLIPEAEEKAKRISSSNNTEQNIENCKKTSELMNEKIGEMQVQILELKQSTSVLRKEINKSKEQYKYMQTVCEEKLANLRKAQNSGSSSFVNDVPLPVTESANIPRQAVGIGGSQFAHVLDEVNIDDAITGSAKPAPSLSREEAENYRKTNKLLYKNCLTASQSKYFEDQFIQMGLLQTINIPMKSAIFKVHFGNKSQTSVLHIKSLELVGEESKGLKVSLENTPKWVEAAKKKVGDVRANIGNFFINCPSLHLEYEVDGYALSADIQLPLNILMFCQPLDMSLEDYISFRDSLQPSQQSTTFTLDISRFHSMKDVKANLSKESRIKLFEYPEQGKGILEAGTQFVVNPKKSAQAAIYIQINPNITQCLLAVSAAIPSFTEALLSNFLDILTP